MDCVQKKVFANAMKISQVLTALSRFVQKIALITVNVTTYLISVFAKKDSFPLIVQKSFVHPLVIMMDSATMGSAIAKTII